MLDFLENLHMGQFESNKDKYGSNILRSYMQNINLGNLVSKLKSSNLHKNLLPSSFEDSKYKYDMVKGFLNSNPDFGKCSSSTQILWDQHGNLVSS